MYVLVVQKVDLRGEELMVGRLLTIAGATVLAATDISFAFSPLSSFSSPAPGLKIRTPKVSPRPLLLNVDTGQCEFTSAERRLKIDNKLAAHTAISAAILTALTFAPQNGNAAVLAVNVNNDPITSAVVAYAHYLSLLLLVAAITTERITVKPSMTINEEKILGYADIVTGISGVGLLVSGYYRATIYGKGWEFYSHEPLFWAKMTFLGIFGALSLFPTITIIQRTVAIQLKQDIEPMSEALAARMRSILNAELSALVFIPLTATLMSRGVGYVEEFPTEIVGPAIFGTVTAGAVFTYVKQALSWNEPKRGISEGSKEDI